MKIMGENLKKCRKQLGFTQLQIAEQLNVDRSTYSNYERNITEPDIKTLLKLSRIFRIAPNELLSAELPSKVTDDAPMPIYYLSKDEKNLVINFRLLSEDKRLQVSEYIDEIKEK